MADERGPDGKFLPGNQASAGRTEPIVPTDWTPPHSAGPSRGYSWAPFAVRHGASLERITAPLVRQRVEEHLSQAAEPDSATGYLLEPQFLGALERLARAEVRSRLIAAWLEEHGLHDSEGRLRPEVEALRRCDEQAANLAARLGLDPLSRSKLFGNLAQARADVAAAEAQRRLRERAAAREAEQAAVPNGEGPTS